MLAGKGDEAIEEIKDENTSSMYTDFLFFSCCFCENRVYANYWLNGALESLPSSGKDGVKR